MTNFYKGGRGLCLPDQTVETLHATSLRKKQRPHQRYQDVPQYDICDIRRGEPRGALRRKISFAQYGRHTSTRKRANHYSPLPLILIFICCLFNNATLAQSHEEGGAVAGVEEIRPLAIGDTIPEALWHMPLQVVNHPDGRDTITLNEYRDKKLIILDFWATWCGPCIRSLYKLDTLQHQFPKDLSILPTTYENSDKVMGLFRDKQWCLPSVVSQTQLKNYFPHRSIPHQVWIRNNRLMALTGSTYSNYKNIDLAINGGEVQMMAKIEDMLTDPKSIIEDIPENILIQSTFSKRIAADIGGFYRNSNGLAIYNNSLLGILKQALYPILGTTYLDNRIIWDIDNKKKDRITPPIWVSITGDYENDWRSSRWLEDNIYCYYLVYPTAVSELDLMSRFKVDIVQFMQDRMGVSVSIEKREINAFVLEDGDYKSATGHLAVTGAHRFDHFNSLLNSLRFVNRNDKRPFINLIKDTRSIRLPINIDVPLNNMEALISELDRVGIRMSEKKVTIDMIIISDYSGKSKSNVVL